MTAVTSGAHRWRAPGRINLIGEHTDYNEGFALPLAIAPGCTATIEAAPPGAVTLRSAQRPGGVQIPAGAVHPGAAWLAGDDGWAGYAVGVLWALAEVGLIERSFLEALPNGLLISIDSDVPSGGGLSSSAALGCSVAGALSDTFGLKLDLARLAELAQRAESEFVGAPTGGMDQLASVFGAADQTLLCDMRTRSTELLPFDLDAVGLSLLVVDTRAPHRNVDGAYGERRAQCAEASRLLGLPALRDATPADLDRLEDPLLRRRARHVITEDSRVLRVAELLRAGDVVGVGPLLTQSHASMRDDFQITVPEVDTAVQTLLSAGALGARMTGGGFGGCVIALIPVADRPAAESAVHEAFAGAGFAAPVTFTARASAGAHRLR